MKRVKLSEPFSPARHRSGKYRALAALFLALAAGLILIVVFGRNLL